MSINLTDAAQTIITADVRAFKRDGKRYFDYVTEMSVTVENLPEHVAAFRDAFKAMCPNADGAAIKAYATKVRNGLRYHLAVDVDETEETEEEKVQNLLTKAGIAASLEDVMAAWHAAADQRNG